MYNWETRGCSSGGIPSRRWGIVFRVFPVICSWQHPFSGVFGAAEIKPHFSCTSMFTIPRAVVEPCGNDEC